MVSDGLPFDYFRDSGHKEELERLIADFSGKEMKVEVQCARPGRNPEEIYPDLTKLVSQVINMEVEELDEEMEDLY